MKHLFPLGFTAGKEAEITPVVSDPAKKDRYRFSPPATLGVQTTPLPLADSETNPVPLIVTRLAVVNEQEPNDTPQTANRITIPCGVNGRIGALNGPTVRAAVWPDVSATVKSGDRSPAR